MFGRKKQKPPEETPEQKQSAACLAAIKSVLDEHKCDMVVQGQFAGNQIQTAVVVIPRKT